MFSRREIVALPAGAWRVFDGGRRLQVALPFVSTGYVAYGVFSASGCCFFAVGARYDEKDEKNSLNGVIKARFR
jgi:hypothetical protein